MLSLELLPFFFAARRDDSGYLFVPSGSGALIDLAERKAGARSLTVPVYGGDFSLEPRPGAGDHGYLPVFGAVREDTGFLAIIESGASIASVSVLKAGVYNSYHTVFADFTITEGRTEARETGDALFGAYAIYAPESYAGDVVSRYHLLPAGSAHYSSMARIYRGHLLERGMPRRARGAGQPLFLDITASVPTTATVAGIPYRSTAVATGYRDARRMLSELDNPAGLIVRYGGWLAGGTAHRFPGRVSLNGKLGSRREFLRLLDFCRQRGIGFYPAVDFLAINERGLFDGFATSREAARGLDRTPVRLLDHNPALTEDVATGTYLISPAALPGVIGSFAGRYGRIGHPFLGLDRFGLLSFSDYRRGADPERIFNPEETLHVLDEATSQLADAGFGLLIEGANAHLPPTRGRRHARPLSRRGLRHRHPYPFHSCRWSCTARCRISSEPVNYQADQRTALLRAIESGSSLTFAVVGDAPALPAPLHDVDLYASQYASWKDTMLAMHGTLSRALAGLGRVPIRRACHAGRRRARDPLREWRGRRSQLPGRAVRACRRDGRPEGLSARAGAGGVVGRVDLARKKARMGYLFTLPLMVGIVLFLIMPIAQSISFSMGEIELIEGGYLLHPVGLANFHHVLRVDTFFPRHLAAAVVKLASEVPVVLVLGLICASLLNRPFRGRGVMRTILFLPVILSSGVLVTLQQSYLLTQELGIGTLFERFTRQMVSGWVVESAAVDGALSYIVDATARLPAIAAAAGIPILIFLAGLQGIPDSMYEVARIEGANAWESFFYITVPLAAPLIFPIIVYMIVDSFTAADSELLRYITQSMQSGAGYGAATAMAWVFFGSMAIILAIVGAVAARWTRNSRVDTGVDA